MTRPNFDTMTKAQLRAYVIANQDDRDAFYTLVDRLQSQSASKPYPSSMTPEEIDKAIVDYLETKEERENKN